MSKILSAKQRERMYQKRKQLQMDADTLSIILNSRKEDIMKAQVGLPIPDEVEIAIIEWLR